MFCDQRAKSQAEFFEANLEAIKKCPIEAEYKLLE